MADTQRLEKEISYEIKQLKEVAVKASALSSLPESERRIWDAAAAAKYIADITLGLENLWKRRCKFLGENYPDSFDSHSQVLSDFLASEGLGASLSAETRSHLKKYLRFRHRFFHSYGHQVRWEIVKEPLALMKGVVDELESVWLKWLVNLK